MSRTTFWRQIARQLADPSGRSGRVVAGILNRVNRSMNAEVIERLAPHAGEVVMDVGFGGGVGLKQLLRRADLAHIHGVEHSAVCIDEAVARWRRDCVEGRLTLHQADVADLPLDDASVDATMSVNTVYFWEDLVPAFAELARVTRAGGRLIIGINHPSLLASAPFTSYGLINRPPGEVADALYVAGWPTVQVVSLRRGFAILAQS